MIIELKKINSKLSILQEIPTCFFEKIEASKTFGDHLFPKWSTSVFSGTDMKKKFEAVYVKYKTINNKADRDKIILGFADSNKIELLCNNDPTTTIVTISALPPIIQSEIDKLFLYLYTSSLEYHKFETFAKDTVKKAIDRFIAETGMQICPICGLEGYLNLEGQARIALDHWLYKDLFPFAAINFDNLLPIGDKCNSRPAKGTRNVLIDENDKSKRIIAYYPFHSYGGVNSIFDFKNEPIIEGIEEKDWEYILTPINPDKQMQFDSWTSVFNIIERYNDFFRKYIFLSWEEEYVEFIRESGLGHANDINEFKQKLSIWNAAFSVKKRFGAILYKAFINYLINRASNAYLYSLTENFKRQRIA